MGIFDWLFGNKKKSESDKIKQKEKHQRFEDERSKELEQREKLKEHQSLEEETPHILINKKLSENHPKKNSHIFNGRILHGPWEKDKNVDDNDKKSDFGKKYHDLEETLLGENSSYIEEYGFIKLLREKVKKGEVKDMLDLKSYIKNHHKKYDGGEIMFKTELYNQLEHVFTVYLEEWEKKKETNFVGFKDVEQYHSLSQKIVVELGDLLQEKIMELGK